MNDVISNEKSSFRFAIRLQMKKKKRLYSIKGNPLIKWDLRVIRNQMDCSVLI